MKSFLLILFPIGLFAQTPQPPQLNLPNYEEVRRGKVMEFISYPMFYLSGTSYGMSREFQKIDSPKSNRPEIYSIGASVGFVTSTGMWGVGISLQGKPKWTDLYKLAGGFGFSVLGYYSGKGLAEILPSK